MGGSVSMIDGHIDEVFPCKVGDVIGYIEEYAREENKWELVESKVTSIRLTKEGLKIYAPKRFRPLYAEDVEFNTKLMEGDSLIVVKEPFVLTEKTRFRAERWVAAANSNPAIVKSIWEG